MSRDLYNITITAPGIPAVIVMPDGTPVTVTDGYGGWTVVGRQRRVGLTVWEGKEPLRMVLPVLFDGVVDKTSQEVQISRLSRMALPPTIGGEPPQVKVNGHALPEPGPTLWVIEKLSWGQNVLRDFSSNGVHSRLRQDCTINLLEYRADDVVAFKSLAPGNAASTGASNSGWPKMYVVKKGDTLMAIAAHFYHDASKWKSIADANKIRDPAIFKTGAYFNKTLRIPAS